MYERLKEREEIFERMHAGLGMNRRGILMLILTLGKSDALSIHLKIFKDGSLPDAWGDYTLERFLHDLNFDFSQL